MHLISVILTTYNSEKTLTRILNSIHSQKGLNKQFKIEMLVVDDCSTDRTVEILKQNNIEYVSTGTNSGGPNKGRNIGLKNATGEFICITDHDDEWLPNRIVTQLSFVNEAAIISSGYNLIDTNTQKKIIRSTESGSTDRSIFYPRDVTFKKLLSKSREGQNVYFGSLLFSADLKGINFEEHFGMVDYDWVLRLFHHQSSIEICDPLYNRYVSGSNLSLDENYRRNDFDFSLKTLKVYEKEFPVETKKAMKRIFGSRARFLYLIGKMKEARYYFLRSGISFKMILYYLTSFIGSRLVKKYFHIFG